MINWLESHLLPCLFYKLTGIPCPTCGFQSSFILLLKGDFQQSVLAYPPLIPTIFMLAVALTWLFVRKPGWNLVYWVIKIDFLIILINYILKLTENT